MDRFIQGPLADRGWNLMRRIGYAEQKVVGEEIGFTRRLQGTPFPRFHAYTEEKDGGLRISLHLDQRATTHGQQSAHGGEYGGPLVERELDRIVSEITRVSKAPTAPKPPEPPEEKGFLARLFGG